MENLTKEDVKARVIKAIDEFQDDGLKTIAARREFITTRVNDRGEVYEDYVKMITITSFETVKKD